MVHKASAAASEAKAMVWALAMAKAKATKVSKVRSLTMLRTTAVTSPDMTTLCAPIPNPLRKAVNCLLEVMAKTFPAAILANSNKRRIKTSGFLQPACFLILTNIPYAYTI